MNRTKFHSLGSEFSLYCMELESSETHSSTSEISSLHRWSELSTRLFLSKFSFAALMTYNLALGYISVITWFSAITPFKK